MSTIIFKTEEAIFHFDQKAVMECLEHRRSSYEIQVLDTLIQVLSSQPETATLSIEKHRYFGYIALDLIGVGKGSVVCQNCDYQYDCYQIEAFTVKPDEATFNVNKGKKGGPKRLFRKKPKPFKFGMYGGKGYSCPHGHTLIFMVTWRT